MRTASRLLLPSPQVRPAPDVEIVALPDQGPGLLGPPGLDRLDDGALMPDLKDGASQHRVVVAAELPHELPHARHVVEAPQQVPDEHQGVIFALPRAEFLGPRRVARGLVGSLGWLGHRVLPARGGSGSPYNTRTWERHSGRA